MEKIVITHPEFWVVSMTPEQQADIVRKYDVLPESVYAQPVNGSYKISIPDQMIGAVAVLFAFGILIGETGFAVKPA